MIFNRSGGRKTSGCGALTSSKTMFKGQLKWQITGKFFGRDARKYGNNVIILRQQS